MKYGMRYGSALAISMALLFQVGCEQEGPVVVPDAPPPAVGGDGHDHAAHGPHGGDIVELGSEAYHAEVVRDDAAKSVTVYILDESATIAVPVDALEATINLAHEGEGMQFKLAASPDADDPEGRSTRFVSTEAELVEELEHGHGDAQLVITIDGKQYRGAIGGEHAGHDHDHEGHSHD